MAVTINASTSSGLVQTADTSGTVQIQSNGTTKLTVASTGAYGQLISGTAVTAATGSPTSIDFTSIPSWVKRVTVNCVGVSLSGSASLLIQIGSGSVTSSGYASTANASSAGPTISSYNSTAGFTIGGATASNIFSGSMVICALTSTIYCESFSGKLSTGGSVNGGGDVTLSGVLDRVRITSTNGTDTFDAGTINLLWEG